MGELEIKQDLLHEKREWLVERIGWCIMGLLILAALLGLLGNGPLSSKIEGDKNSLLWVEYDRYGRYQAPAILKIHLKAGSSQAGQARVSVNRDYIENMEIQNIEPEPYKVEAGRDRLTYSFNISDPTQSTAVAFHLKANKYGSMPVRINLENGPELNFSQFF